MANWNNLTKGVLTYTITLQVAPTARNDSCQMPTASNFHFPQDIKLRSAPVSEAWLEIRWQLEPMAQDSRFMRDAGFPFALGTFYLSIKDRFPHREDLDASRAPLDILPYVVRHRFRAGEGESPLIQFGPGVATVNFTQDYSWHSFKDMCLYLREKLSEAYSEKALETATIALRYQNAELFSYTSDDVLRYLSDNLNTMVSLPTNIPGPAANRRAPSSASIAVTYDLVEPVGTGTVLLASGTKKMPDSTQEGDSEVIVWQLEVASKDDNAPSIEDPDEFSNWLDAAHASLHEWFFSFVEGQLLDKYEAQTSP